MPTCDVAIYLWCATHWFYGLLRASVADATALAMTRRGFAFCCLQ